MSLKKYIYACDNFTKCMLEEEDCVPIAFYYHSQDEQWKKNRLEIALRINMLKWAPSMIFFLSLVNLTCTKIKAWNIGI